MPTVGVKAQTQKKFLAVVMVRALKSIVLEVEELTVFALGIQL